MPFSFLPDLSRRHRRPELMDQPDLDEADHRRALRGLARINRFTQPTRILWPPIEQLARRMDQRSVTLLEVACGSGDGVFALSRRAARKGIFLQAEGCDISPLAVDQARREAQSRNLPVSFFECDALASPLPEGYDVVTCSLFLHHLDEEQAVLLLKRMAQAARHLVLVQDLVRSRRGYLLAYWGARLLSRSSIVHVDGPRSVEGAFTLAEAKQLADQAGLKEAVVSQHWPHRFLLTCPLSHKKEPESPSSDLQ